MNQKDRKAIDQIIANLEKLNETTDLYNNVIDEIIEGINELKDSIDKRLENVADCGLSQTEQNIEKQEVSDALDNIISSLGELQENLNEIQGSIDTLSSL